LTSNLLDTEAKEPKAVFAHFMVSPPNVTWLQPHGIWQHESNCFHSLKMPKTGLLVNGKTKSKLHNRLTLMVSRSTLPTTMT
jgi:hypothetical protein